MVSVDHLDCGAATDILLLEADQLSCGSTSKSAVSRTFVQRTRDMLWKLMNRPLAEMDGDSLPASASTPAFTSVLAAWAARVHPRFRTPYVTTILTGVFVGIPAMFVDINEAIEFTNIGTLFAFVLVSVGVIVLRRSDPGRHRLRLRRRPLPPNMSPKPNRSPRMSPM